MNQKNGFKTKGTTVESLKETLITVCFKHHEWRFLIRALSKRDNHTSTEFCIENSWYTIKRLGKS